LVLGTLALALSASAAFADEGYRHHEDRRDYWGERADRHDMRRDEFTIMRDRARLEHELREGDWREAEQLRRKLWWEQRDLARDRWAYDGYR
jgi:hypothetical protein